MNLYTGPMNMEEDNFRDYFFTMDPDNFDLDGFIRNWAQMRDHFSPKSLHRALQKTANLTNLIPEDQADKLVRFLRGPCGLPRWADFFQPKLKYLGGRELASISWSLGEIGIRPSREFLKTLRNLSKNRMRSGQANHLDLSDILQGFGKLQINPGRTTMNTLFVHIKDRINDYNFSALASIVKTAGDLNTSPHPSFLDACVAFTENRLADPKSPMTSADLRAYLAGITMMSARSGHDVDKEHIRKIIHEAARLDVPDTGALVLFHQAASYFGIDGYPDQPWPQKLTAEWKSEYVQAFNQVSGFVRFPVRVEGVHYLPDISGSYAGKKVVIFIDGPTRFVDKLNGGLQYNGHTLLKTALVEKTLKKELPETRALRACFDDIAGAEETNGMNYQSILQNLTEAEPGLYQSTFDGYAIGLAPIRG